MTFCPNCQYLNPETAMKCLSCGAPLWSAMLRQQTVTIPLTRSVSGRIDKLGVVVGVAVLMSLVAPWIVGTGSFTFSSSSGGSLSASLVTLGFPFAVYSYSPELALGEWSAFPAVQYTALAFLLIGAPLMIVASAAGRYRNLSITGSLFSALAPIALSGFSQTSVQTSSGISSSSFVTFPIGAVLPVVFGLLAIVRSHRLEEPPSTTGRIVFMPSQTIPSQTLPTQPRAFKFCPSCGSNLLLNAKFCQACGTSLANYPPQQSQS